jgi:uncharacterized protein YuzE
LLHCVRNDSTYSFQIKIQMKVKYDKQTDILYIRLSDIAIDESDEDKDGIILDYSANGQLVGIEVLNKCLKNSH